MMKNKTEETWTERLEWALAMVMDGVKEHDIVPQCGCSDEDAKKIYAISREAIEKQFGS